MSSVLITGSRIVCCHIFKKYEVVDRKDLRMSMGIANQSEEMDWNWTMPCTAVPE
ncbi:hypothetical protein BU24DRAFT_417758 [Aaosphaeria arxii CBS 175.79]|uniref:Uncharacterized protein n=1 Tax=Aaosphaeria arxii CBS 175.79 TaxID=1450172 RepID=A0A6A5YAQ4_9PLEO|nr:uncharacterized protein BU24DRAFT_417758 [Aaosphaeria arxii CBS 175.79]KAF2022107.1 hypothetical protein BU24DRAFT_417758 [Aaosphaeria arxii CBS 175.79]